MRFVVDADLTRAIDALIISYRHVAIDVRDVGLGDADDPDIAAYAKANDLCLVTGDWGFSDIRIYPPADYPGVVVIGLPVHATGPMFVRALRQLLNRPDLVAALPGRLTIVEMHRIRMRPPP